MLSSRCLTSTPAAVTRSPRRQFRPHWALLGLLLLLDVVRPPASAAPAGTGTPAPIYLKNCGPCHGADGRARTPAGRKAGAHDLRESKATPDEIRKSIKEGRTDKSGAAKMPAFGDKISDAEIEVLIQTVLAFRK